MQMNKVHSFSIWVHQK